MTTSRASQHHPRPSLPLIAATTAALPAVVLSSLAVAQPAAAEPRARAVPATLAAAMRAQAKADVATSLKGAVIPAASVPAALPNALRPAKAAAPAEYTIARGDTISAVAGRYGLDTYAVLKLNNLQANTIIYPGQKIKLTGSTAAPAATASAPATVKPATAGALAPAALTSSRPATPSVASPPATASAFPRSSSGTGSAWAPSSTPGQKIKLGAGSTASAPSNSAPARMQPRRHLPPQRPAPVPTRSRPATRSPASPPATAFELSDVLSANRLTMSSIIYPGQKLAIPGASTIAPASSKPAATTPLVPSTFLGYTYPAAVVSSANQNKALLNASPGPQPPADEDDRGGHRRRMGVDASLALAFAYQESGFDQRAVSPANAIGTMQVIPSSGQWASDLVGRKLNLLDPYDNATAGVAIIRQLVNSSPDLDTAIAGYYQGQYSVSQNGMFEDTKGYVAAIKANRTLFS